MFLFSLLLLAAAAPEPIKVASPGLRVIDIPADRGEFYGQHFANQMLSAGVQMITEREISAMLGLERQKALLGCSEGNECMVELANALGVQGILVGDIARLGNRYQVGLKIIDPRFGRPLSIRSFRVNDEEALIDGLSSAAFEMAGEVLGKFGRTPVAAQQGGGVRRTSWWIPAAGGALAAGAGAVCLGFSLGELARLAPDQPPATLTQLEAADTVTRGKGLNTAAVVLFAVGAAAAVTAVGIAAFGTETRVAAIATPEGGGLFLAGSWP